MTSFSTKGIAFPGNVSPLTERRVRAQAWANALRPYFRYVNVIDKDGSLQVIAENGGDVVITLEKPVDAPALGDLWTMDVYSRRDNIEYSYPVGNLQDVLVSVLREL